MRTRPQRVDGWQRMCLGKKRYRTSEFADKVAQKWGQSVYFCPFCSGFHCTKQRTENSQPQRVPQ